MGRKKSKREAAKQEAPKEMLCMAGSQPKNFGIGQSIFKPCRWLGRMVRWPKYIRVQRQKKILMQRLKVPPVVAQFQHTLEKNPATKLFKILAKHRPETKAETKARIKENLKNDTQIKQPICVKYGLKRVTNLIVNKAPKLVVIANDVDPLELVMWMPTLCIKMDVPFCIVKSKARLGRVVNMKTCTCLCLVQVKPASAGEFDKLLEVIRPEWLEAGPYREWGGGILSRKALAKQAAREKKQGN